MALNWPVFRTRALTAIVFVAVMLVGLLWNEWSFLLLFSMIHFGCWWEYLKLMEKIGGLAYHINLKIGIMLLGYGIMLHCPILTEQLLSKKTITHDLSEICGKINLSFMLIVSGTLLTLAGTIQQKTISIKAFAKSALGLFYISLAWGLMLILYSSFDINLVDTMYVFGNPKLLPILIIASIWINDTMAYVVGSFIGKTPFSKISPKKTWEGTVGGIIISMLVIGALFPIVILGRFEISLFYFAMLIAVIASITGTFGDLLESKLKRMADVKDSGNIMPGHGGFLDRFDSLLLASPFVWLFIVLLQKMNIIF